MDKSTEVAHNQRAQTRILLCDVNAESCHEIHMQLTNCAYQVAAVWAPIDVFDTINSQGPRADIILASVDILMENEGRVLRYIMRQKNLQQIPVISKDTLHIYSLL